MYQIFEVLRSIGAVIGTASVVKSVNKYSLYGHLLPIQDKHLTESFTSDWPHVYQVVSEHIAEHMVICE